MMGTQNHFTGKILLSILLHLHVSTMVEIALAVGEKSVDRGKNKKKESLYNSISILYLGLLPIDIKRKQCHHSKKSFL